MASFEEFGLWVRHEVTGAPAGEVLEISFAISCQQLFGLVLILEVEMAADFLDVFAWGSLAAMQ